MATGPRSDTRLILRRIEVEGFNSYLKPVVFDLKGGVVAVTGKNGTGKSTITSKALTWLVYGKCAPERMGSSAQSLKGKDIVNDDAKEARVKAIMTRGPTTYEIERIKGKGRDQATVLANGVVTNIDPAVVVGVDFNVFVRTVVRGQNDPWNFAEATDGEKRKIIDIVSGALELETAHQEAKKAAKQLKSEIDVIDAVLTSLAIQAAVNVDELHANIANINAQIATGTASNAWITDYVAKLGPEPILDLAPFGQASVVADQRQAIAKQALGAVTHELAVYRRAQPGHPCPVCEEVVDPLSGIAIKAENAAQRLSTVRDESKAADLHAGECHQRHREASKWLSDQKAAWNAARRKYNRVDIAQLEGQLATLQSHLSKIKDQRAENLRQHAVNTQAKKQIARSLRLAEQWVKALSPRGARAHLADATLAAIGAEASKWGSILSAGKMSIDLTSTRETAKKTVREQIVVAVTTQTPAGKVVKRKLLQISGGERARINLAIDLGVSAVFGGMQTLSLLILDEKTFSGMDSDGKQAVIEAMNAAEVHDVIVIDHDPALTGALERTIVVERGADGYSQIREL